MRQHLITCMSTHIIDFSLRLREDFLACYEYVPLLTAVHYPELEGELWCQPYFLRNLVNTEVFPEWRIDHPFQILRAVIDLWRREQQRQTSRHGMCAWVCVGERERERERRERESARARAQPAHKYVR